MPFPSPHNYLQVYGTNATGTYKDIWTFGLRIGGPGTGDNGVAQSVPVAVLDAIDADLRAWWTANGAAFAATTKMLGFKFNAVDVEGRYLSEGVTAQRTFGAAGLPGTAAGVALPPQVSCAVTLHTNVARGLAAKGRIYLPPFHTGMVAEGGVMLQTTATQQQDRFATLLNNLNNWPGIDALADPGNVIVASRGGVNSSEGVIRKVTGVSVGTVLDTQRRRRSAFVEQRVDAAVVA